MARSGLHGQTPALQRGPQTTPSPSRFKATWQPLSSPFTRPAGHEKCQLVKPANQEGREAWREAPPLLARSTPSLRERRELDKVLSGSRLLRPGDVRSPCLPLPPPQAGSPSCCPAAELFPRGAAGPVGPGWATAAVGRQGVRGCGALWAAPDPGPPERCGAAPGGLGDVE